MWGQLTLCWCGMLNGTSSHFEPIVALMLGKGAIKHDAC